MGVTGPRAPAVHRAITVLDAIWSGRATSPAEITTTLGLAKSSVADLIGSLEVENLAARTTTGQLRIGGLWEDLSDRNGTVELLLRATQRLHDLDGHTIAIYELVGSRACCLDVRQGQLPLPLTPRPGQYRDAHDCAAAMAVIAALPVQAVTNHLQQFASHQNLSTQDIQDLLDLRQNRRPSTTVRWTSPTSGFEISTAVPGTRIAITVHLGTEQPRTAQSSRIDAAVAGLTHAVELSRSPVSI